DFTITGKQRHPAGDRSGAVPGPVVHGHEPRVQAVGITEKSKIGGEVQLVEIGAAVGQSIRRDTYGVEAEGLCPVEEIRLELSNHAAGVKRGDEHRAGGRTGEFGYRRGRAPKDGLADPSRLLY